MLGTAGLILFASGRKRRERIIQRCEEQPSFRVSNAGQSGAACNGVYTYRGLDNNGYPEYISESGGIIYYRGGWKINGNGSRDGWHFSTRARGYGSPPHGEWTTEGYSGDITDMARVSSETHEQRIQREYYEEQQRTQREHEKRKGIHDRKIGEVMAAALDNDSAEVERLIEKKYPIMEAARVLRKKGNLAAVEMIISCKDRLDYGWTLATERKKRIAEGMRRL